MRIISTGRLEDCLTELTADAIRAEVHRFARLLCTAGARAVKVWCSWNPDLPHDSPLQSPKAIIPPDLVLDFFETAVRNRVWAYGDVWNRAGIDAVDGSFRLFLGNDKDISLDSEIQDLLDATRSAWVSAGYEVHEKKNEVWVRINPPPDPSPSPGATES